MRPFLLTNTMNSTHTANDNDNDDSELITNFHVCVIFMSENSCDYSSFDMHLVFNYMNNQLIYYYISDAISAIEQLWFQQLMQQHKIFLDLLSWNDASDKNNNLRENSEDSHISENDSDFISNFLKWPWASAGLLRQIRLDQADWAQVRIWSSQS